MLAELDDKTNSTPGRKYITSFVLALLLSSGGCGGPLANGQAKIDVETLRAVEELKKMGIEIDYYEANKVWGLEAESFVEITWRGNGEPFPLKEASSISAPLIISLVECRTDSIPLVDISRHTDLVGVTFFKCNVTREDGDVIRSLGDLQYLAFKESKLDVPLNEPLCASRATAIIFNNMDDLSQLLSNVERVFPENLQSLELSHCQLDGQAIEEISSIRSLKRLDINKSGVTDAAFERFLEMPNLEFLNISGNPISDASILAFSRFPALQKLNTFRTQLDGMKVQKQFSAISVVP